MSDIVKIENGVLTKESKALLITLYEVSKKAQEQYDAYKDALLKAMEENGIKKIETDDVVINYIEPTEMESFDKKAFRKDHSDLYDEYVSFNPVKSKIRVTIK